MEVKIFQYIRYMVILFNGHRLYPIKIKAVLKALNLGSLLTKI